LILLKVKLLLFLPHHKWCSFSSFQFLPINLRFVRERYRCPFLLDRARSSQVGSLNA
jgi:hypothetical protein